MNKLRIIPVGGLGEVGKNMTVYENDTTILAIDAGLKFPSYEMYGIDFVIPDINYIRSKAHKFKGIVVTHGHEDHIGAIPIILKEFPFITIYGTKLTLELIKARVSETMNSAVYKFFEIKPGNSYAIDDIIFIPFRVNHSIADAVGIAISTSDGIIVHTSDFKIDNTPVDNNIFDYHLLSTFGKEGVLLLLSDSTNCERKGFSISEREIGENIEYYVKNTTGKVIIATFASNIHRIQQIINSAVNSNKQVFISGFSMGKNIDIAKNLGYLIFNPGTIMKIEELKKHPPSKVVAIVTGTQGEPMSALSKIANNTYKNLKIEKGDLVILSSSIIPGNEPMVHEIINKLYELGATVIRSETDDIHVSGHAMTEELKIMINLTQPKYFVPIHGEYRHLAIHATLAESVGVEKKNIFILQNGDILELENGEFTKNGNIEPENIFVDGKGIGDVSDIVLRDRKALAADGVVVVIVTLSKLDNTLISMPDILSRGFVYINNAEAIIEQSRYIVKNITEMWITENTKNWDILKKKIKSNLKKYFTLEIDRDPMILSLIIEV